jgi:tRNA dimethylallyltransferase
VRRGFEPSSAVFFPSMQSPTVHPLVVVLGPTGAGKSELGLAIADRFAGEVVNFDSVQMYRGFDLGSAKLTPGERRGIPHHLIDVAEAAFAITAGAFSQMARPELAGITTRGKLPVLVGGTGFYLRALLNGLSPAPTRDLQLRQRLMDLEQRRPAALHRFLRRFDPVAAARIHANDRQKLIRAVEITLLARQPASVLQAQERKALEGYAILKIGLAPERSQLHQRLNQRTEWMFANGLLEETRQLLNAGVASDAKPMMSLGYKQAVAVVAGNLPFADAVRECQTRTRQYAKRQITWFRAERDVCWLHGFGSDSLIQAEALRFVRERVFT